MSSLKAETLIGVTYKEAEFLCKMHGYRIRIKSKDGVGFICTADYRPDRIDVEIENDLITKVHIG